MTKLWIMLLLLLLPSPTIAAQVRKASSQAGSRVISGVVLNASTGQPVTEADVNLTDSNGGSFSADATTDAEGRFVFTGLYDGKFSLHAEHRGYVSSGFDEHEGFFTGIVTGEGLVSTDLKFMLAPQAVISGTVTDEAGDPVAQASVQLFRQDDRSGREEVVHVNSAVTDDLGHYELSRLAAGTYFLAVSGTPWYSTHAQPSFSDAPQGRTKSPLDVAFPMVFYDAAMNSDEATPIPIKAADRVPINFTLQAQPAMHITVQIPKPSPNQGMTMPQLKTKIFGNLEPAQQQMQFTTIPTDAGNNGMTTAELDGVPPGSYELEMQKGNGGPDAVSHVDASSGSVVLDAGSLEPLADIDGKVAMDDGSSLPAHVVLVLSPDDGESKTAGVNTSGAFTLRGVAAGEYRVTALGPKGELAVKQLAATGATSDGSLVKIGSAPVMLAVVLAESNTTVHGFAQFSGKAAAGAMIVLIPSDGNRQAFRRDQSDSDGSFVLRQVLPGRYTLVAIQDGWSLEWARSEVLQRYTAQGQKVKVALHGANVELKDPLVVQPR